MVQKSFAPQRDGKPSTTCYPPYATGKLRDVFRVPGNPPGSLDDCRPRARKRQNEASMPHSSTQVSPGASRRKPVPELNAFEGAVIGSMATASGRSG